MTVAEEYPNARVYGWDLNPIQPTWVPPNLEFILDDMEEDWSWEESPYDFIHTADTILAIKDWDRLLGQVLAYIFQWALVQPSACSS